MSLYDIPLTRIDGSQTSLGDHRGKVLLVVNVASRCGLTPQYEGLEALYRDFRDRGLVVLGFPANDFMGQEPGTNAEIADFCRGTFGVDFPMFAKISVTGAEIHPLYAALTEAEPVARFRPDSVFKADEKPRAGNTGAVHWNFEKFLIGRDGQVVACFGPDTDPQDPAVLAAIEAALAG